MKPYKREGRATYYIKFTYLGARRYVDTGETSLLKAERKARAVRDAWIDAYETKTGLTWEQIIAWDYSRYCADREDVKHFDSTIGNHWKRLCEYFTDPYTVTHDALEGYVLWRKSQRRVDGTPQWQKKTIRGHLQTLKRGLKNAHENKGFTSLHIPKNWPALSKQKGRVKGKRFASNDYSPTQLKSMVALLQGHARDTAIIYLCTGVRWGEAHRMAMSHFEPRDDMEGCAGKLLIPAGEEDGDRYIGVPQGLLPILRDALPLTVDHKRAFKAAALKATGSAKFGHRDFRAGFISGLATIDPFGAHMAAGHADAIMGRYHEWSEERMASVAMAAWNVYGLGSETQLGSKVVPMVGSKPYMRKRLKA